MAGAPRAAPGRGAATRGTARRVRVEPQGRAGRGAATRGPRDVYEWPQGVRAAAPTTCGSVS